MPDSAAAKCFHPLPCISLWSMDVYKAFHSREGSVLPKTHLRDTHEGSSHSFPFQVWRFVTQGGAGRAILACLRSSCHQIRPESLGHLLLLSISKVFPRLSDAYHTPDLSLSPPWPSEGVTLPLRAGGDDAGSPSDGGLRL